MNEQELDELEKIAKAATPGPWYGDRVDGTVKYSLMGGADDHVIRGDNGNEDTIPYGIQTDEDEKYLLAFHPATALRLIEASRPSAMNHLDLLKKYIACLDTYDGYANDAIEYGRYKELLTDEEAAELQRIWEELP